MKQKTKKKIQGSISVLLVIILLPMLTFSALIVDMSRVNMAKQMLSSAGDLTMNTALANYDTILKDVYGLFAMSQQKGLDNEGLGTELNKYFAQTLSAYGVVGEADSEDYAKELIGDFRQILNDGTAYTNNFLELEDITLNVEKVTNSSLANASVLRKQIVEYMKYRAPLGVGLSFLDSLTAFEKVDDQNKVIESQVAAQESTQDVTQACKKLIELIRDYDIRVEEVNVALDGKTGSADKNVINLEDYDTHPDQYLSSWKQNYTHINRLNLVFLGNPPSTVDAYLKALSYTASEDYVKNDGTFYSGSKSTGINVSVSPSGDATAALQLVNDQISNLNGNYKQYADKYSSPLLPSTNLSYKPNPINKSVFAKEEDAIKSFINYEKFLLDQVGAGELTYTQVKQTLEQIEILRRYHGYYDTKIGEEISAAQRDVDQKQQTYDGLVNKKDNAAGAMDQRINSIDSTITGYIGGYDSLDDATDFLTGVISTDRYQRIRSSLSSLPARNGDYGSYYSAFIGGSSGADKYLDHFQWLVQSSGFGTGGTDDQKKIIKVSQEYVERNGYDANGYTNYMKGKLNATQEKDDLFKLLCCLKTCHAYAITYKNNIQPYNEAVAAIPGAYSELEAAKTKLAGLQEQKADTARTVKGCLQGYHTFTRNYQGDLYYYDYYMVAAKNTIGPEAKAINEHFTDLQGYLDELRTDLEAISAQVTVVQEAIKTYNAKLDSWQQANTDYANNNGSDSFSGQTSEDIAKARTEYDEDLYDTLDTFVIALWNEFDDLYEKLSEEGNYVYGAKRIDAISAADDLIAAVSSIKGELSDVVTVEEAEGKLSKLYTGSSIEYVPYTMDYAKQLCFLSPKVVQLKALKYLNNAYPEESSVTDEQKQQKDDFDKAKGQLTGEDKTQSEDKKSSSSPSSSGAKPMASGGGKTDEAASTDLGYNYKDKSAKDDVPSKNKVEADTYSDDEYLMEKEGEGDEEKLKAQDSVKEQSKKSGSVLDGIANVATAAVENLYILNYVFENFSYNTIVQEQLIEDNPMTSQSAFGQLSEVTTLLSNADKVTAAKDNCKTLSNFSIDPYNNYLFGAEVEYILFGNSSASTNVTSAKGSIYALRFVFNCIYAFTDAEIRNSTMAAGLAVQAATLGVVPYQIVQIVLQLALAAAESALDLSLMSNGLKVAVIKTKDTWALSMSGAADALKDVGNAAAKMVTDKVTDFATDKIQAVTNGLNDLVSAGADELKGCLTDLTTNMTHAAKGVVEGVADDVVSKLTAQIEESLNQLQYMKVGEATIGETASQIKDRIPTKQEVRTEAQSLFAGIRSSLDGIINEACGGNEMALSMSSRLKTEAERLIKSVEDEIMALIEDAPEDVDVTGLIAGKLNDLKLDMIEQANIFIDNLAQDIEDAANNYVDSATTELQGYISQCGDELSEQAADVIKEKVTGITDNFVETTLKVNGTSSATNVKSSPVSMFKFGYKDYLMLLTYISICCSDSVLLRTADVIQMNLQHANGDKADFDHGANTDDGGKFLMKNACSYISISANADLDMFFMDLGIFQELVSEDTADPTDPAAPTEDKGASLTYKGLLGY